MSSHEAALPHFLTPALPGQECCQEYQINSLQQGHRELEPSQPFPFAVCAARPVPKDEIRRQPKAQEALQKEWDRLRALECWDESKVAEWKDVANKAKNSGSICHAGRIFSLCHEKNSELWPQDPRHKFKGRVVFQGNRVKDQNWNTASFNS